MKHMMHSSPTTPTATATGVNMLTTRNARATRKSVKRYVSREQLDAVL